MKKTWFTIIIIAVIFIAGINMLNDEENINTSNDNKVSNLETENTYTETIYNQNDSAYVTESGYTTSKSGYLITGELEQRRYSLALSDISLLNGFFMLDQSKQNLYAMTYESTCSGHYEGIDLYRCEELPLGINRDKGETLVILGDEWRLRSDYEQENMIINVCDITLLGYGNSSMLETSGISVDDIISVNGITITPKESSTTMDKNYELITQQLKGTDISCVYDFQVSRYIPMCKYLVSSKYNAAVTCQYYEGTQYKSATVNMKEPFVLFDQFDDATTISLPVQTTQNGYFIVDISSLPSGMYAIKKSVYPSGIAYFVVD